jgi:hypothetical protein
VQVNCAEHSIIYNDNDNCGIELLTKYSFLDTPIETVGHKAARTPSQLPSAHRINPLRRVANISQPFSQFFRML